MFHWKRTPTKQKTQIQEHMVVCGRPVVATTTAVDQQYDEAFFRDWIQTLAGKLTVPPMPNQTIFQDSCQAVCATDEARRSAQALVDALAKQSPVDQEALEQAQAALEQAKASVEAAQATMAIVAASILDGLPDFLSCDYDDSDLVTYTVLVQAGAKRLADWCAKGATQTSQVLSLLDNVDLLRAFLQAGGAAKGEYGRAMELYASLTPSNVVLQRLAMAVALELAAPMESRPVNNYQEVDPIARYVHYEQAYLYGVLDPAFASFTVWELRMAINSDASDQELGWGRECLMNYRPDIVLSNDAVWRYALIVRRDVDYKDPVWSKPHHTYDQILSDGGKCGPRAWYGRFICKAFGIPTWGVRQPGHAAMTRWTRDGWKTALGAGFEVSTWSDRCGNDFLLETQARAAVSSDPAYLCQVMRLEMVASFLGESSATIRSDMMPDPKCCWYALALMQRKRLAADSDEWCLVRSVPVSTIDNRLERLAELPNDVSEAVEVDALTQTILIPATSCTTKPNGDILVMKSFLGGQQLFLGGQSTVEYTLELDKLTRTRESQTFQLTVYLCTVHRIENPLILTVSSDDRKLDPMTIEIKTPYTMGMWQETEQVTVELKGRNVTLSLTRQTPKFGTSIKYIKLALA